MKDDFKELRILICGGRTFSDKQLFRRTMFNLEVTRSKFYNPYDNYFPLDFFIISGGARGADTIAIDYAVINQCSFKEYPADWKTHGEKEGILRNIQMLEEGKPDLVVAFPGGRGTAHMVKIAKEKGVEVLEISGR